MNIHPAEIESTGKTKIVKDEDKKQLFLVLKDNDTFDIDVFHNEKELEKIENWYNRIGKVINFEETNINIARVKTDDVISIFGSNLTMDKKNKVMEHLQTVKQFLELRNSVDSIKKKYLDKEENISDKKDSPDTLDIQTSFKRKPNTDKLSIAEGTRYVPNLQLRSDYEVVGHDKKLFDSCTFSSASHVSGISSIGEFNEFSDASWTLPDDELKEVKSSDAKYILVYHTDDISTFILENPDSNDHELLNRNAQKFTNAIEISDDKVGIIAKQLFDEVIFDDKLEYNETLEVFKKIVAKENIIHDTIDERELVYKFIKNTYDITESVENKVKASDLCEKVEYYLEYNIDGFKKGRVSFRNRLSKYLLDIGLKKKRFTEGFYYYGLMNKNVLQAQYNISEDEFNNTDNIIKRMEKLRDRDIDVLFKEKERKKEIKHNEIQVSNNVVDVDVDSVLRPKKNNFNQRQYVISGTN